MSGLVLLMLCGVFQAKSNQAAPEKPLSMASNADPSFEVATIKPTDPDSPANVLLLGHRINCPGTTVLQVCSPLSKNSLV